MPIRDNSATNAQAGGPPAATDPRQNNYWYRREPSPHVVVFLHGIFSDSRSCWHYRSKNGEQSVYWPDLVASDPRLERPSTYMAGYHTSLGAGDFSMSQAAREVLEALESQEPDGTPPVLEAKQLIFVCHSTGGIVARYLIERHKSRFRDKLVGLALIASPSLGSRWATIALLAAKYYNQRLGVQLRWQGETLEELHNRFRDLVNERSRLMPGLFGMEAAENQMIFRDKVPRLWRILTPNRLKVVPTLSAGQYFGEVKILRGTDHFSCVKPSGYHHPAHEFLVTFFTRFREHVRRMSATEFGQEESGKEIIGVTQNVGIAPPGANPLNALHAFPIGPMVRSIDIPLKLIDIFAAHFAGNPTGANACVSSAMSLRRAANPEGFTDRQILVTPGELPDARQGLHDYWTVAIHLAGQKSRRTLAALLLDESAPRPEFLAGSERTVLVTFTEWLKRA